MKQKSNHPKSTPHPESSSESQHKSHARLEKLMAASLAIPGLGLVAGTPALAQTAPSESTIRIQYADYHEWQRGSFHGGGQDRMDIQSPQLWFDTPIGEAWELQGGFVLDSMSGASPLYLSSLSGASGTGIHDTRRAVDLKLTRYFKRFSLGIGGTYSNEDDYRSGSGVVETKIWSSDKNTIFTFGAGGARDRVESSLAPTFGEDLTSQSYIVGVTQVLTPVDIVQSNFSVGGERGFLSDPYKTYDNRPANRDQYAWLTRYIHHIKSIAASLHLDYRYYWDSWDIESHMLDFAWYQPLGQGWTIRPNLRYYTQNRAEFFSNVYPPSDFDTFYSADQRMADFGSFTTGLKVIKELSDGLSLDLKFELMQQHRRFKLGGDTAAGIEPFFARTIVFGITKTF